jgi:hypothetical protein
MSDTPGIGVMLGKGAEVVSGGKTWKVSAPDQNSKDRLAKLAAAVAIAEVEKLEGTLPPKSFDRAYRHVIQNLKDYHTWGEGWQRIVLGSNHYFLWALLQESHPHITEAEVLGLMSKSPGGVAAAYAQVLPDFFHLLAEVKLLEVPEQSRAEAREKMKAIIDGTIATVLAQLTPTPATST